MWFGIRRCELGPIVGAGQAEGAPCRYKCWLSFGEVLLDPEGHHDPDCEEPEDCHLMIPVLELEQVLNRNSGFCTMGHLEFPLEVYLTCNHLSPPYPSRTGPWEARLGGAWGTQGCRVFLPSLLLFEP